MNLDIQLTWGITLFNVKHQTIKQINNYYFMSKCSQNTDLLLYIIQQSGLLSDKFGTTMSAKAITIIYFKQNWFNKCLNKCTD